LIKRERLTSHRRGLQSNDGNLKNPFQDMKKEVLVWNFPDIPHDCCPIRQIAFI
jgi:hypothetical protein